MSFKASAPGSLMLLGEYAVLHGGDALVCAIDQRMSVLLTPRNDKRIKINSSLGIFETSVADIAIAAPFEFVLTILHRYQKQLPSGCDITITSEFSHRLGLGSSAAVTAAMLTVMHQWLMHSIPDALSLITEARNIIRQVQGQGSGADVAASILGGIVAYRADPVHAEKFTSLYPITVVYSGSKTKTRDAIAYVTKKFAAQPEALRTLLNEIAQCARAGIQAVREQNREALGQAMSAQQRRMDGLGVSTATLNDIIHAADQSDHLQGAKISGAGLGDCVIALGQYPLKEYTVIPCAMTSQGVCHEKN